MAMETNASTQSAALIRVVTLWRGCLCTEILRGLCVSKARAGRAASGGDVGT